MPLSGRFTIGPFDLELITLTHSIPEPNAVALRTPVGTVLHTGDWKFDPDPLIGPTADEAALRRLGDEGVLALIGDSTNALRPGTSGSEADLRRSLTDLIGRYDARVAVACFASNVARLETIARAAAAHGREVALVGRSLWRIDKAARENGYLADLPRFLTEDEAGYIPRDRIVLICTGSQGEPRAALLADRPRRPPAHRARDRRCRDLFVAHHSRATRRRSTGCRTRWSGSASRSSPRRTISSTSRAIRPATSWCACTRWSARRLPSRCMAKPAI